MSPRSRSHTLDVIRGAIALDSRSMTAIAHAAKISPSTISSWLDGDTKEPHPKCVERVLNVLGVVQIYVYAETGEPVVPIKLKPRFVLVKS